MAAYRSFLALSDLDPQCMGFIEAYANATVATISTGGAAAGAAAGTGAAGAEAQGGSSALGNAIERGMVGVAENAMKEAMQSRDALEIIRD